MAALTPPVGETPWIEALLKYLPPVMIAMFGGLINLLNSKKTYFSFKLYMVGIITAGFVGIILKAVSLHMNLSEETTTIVAALGGYCWRDVLKLLRDAFLERVKKGGGE